MLSKTYHKDDQSSRLEGFGGGCYSALKDLEKDATTIRGRKMIFAQGSANITDRSSIREKIIFAQGPANKTDRSGNRNVGCPVFMFTGSGSQYVGMGIGLCETA